LRVLIIGGGIGGLSAAIALRRKSIDADVFEKNAEVREVGAGISLWPNAVKALQKLNLGEALDAISLVNKDAALRRWNGSYLSRTPTRELERRFGGGVIVLHRAELLDMLAASFGPANIRLGHALAGIHLDAGGVTANFANGASAHGDALIGADGLHSMVRTWLGRADLIRYSGYTAWRAVVPFDASTLVPGETWGCGQRFGMLPVQRGRVYWFATSNAPEGERHGQLQSKDSERARLLALFKGWHQPIESLIQASEDSAILRNDIYDREPLHEWGRGRITLLGDAAHPMTPNLGQGGCLAIEDALELASSLAAAPDIAVGLRAYESRRIPRTTSIVLASRRLGAVGQIASPLLCRIRDLVFRLTPSGVTLRSLAPVVGYEGHLSD
jgi:2-polyprenyl-6-methoxyphenol hydroxylase-like FAD-dependent oxidoreductase